jgi:hypothetical protein
MSYYFSNYLTDEEYEAVESKGTCPVCKKNHIKGRQTKYCSVECRMIAHSETHHPTNQPVDRNCVECGVEFTGTGFYCSEKCDQQNKLKKHQNPFSEYGTKGKKRQKKAKHKQEERYGLGDPTWMDGSFIGNIPDNVRYIVASIPDEPYMQEDMQEIDKIIIEELTKCKAKKAPNISRENRIRRAKKSLAWEKGLKFDYKRRKYLKN